MASTRAAALAALVAAIRDAVPAGTAVQTDSGLGEEVPYDRALVLLANPTVLSSEVYLSPLTYGLTLSVDCNVSADDDASLQDTVAALAGLVGADADRTLGDVVEWWEFGDPAFTATSQIGDDGAPTPPLHEAQIPVRLTYLALSPLG